MSQSPIIDVIAPTPSGTDAILTPAAIKFLGHLAATFEDSRQDLLARRRVRKEAFAKGAQPCFLAHTAHVRAGTWKVAPLKADLTKRTVEITGPPDRKMIINALNSSADCFMCDFEDSNCPTWENGVQGQQNLFDAVRRTISLTHPKTGKQYQLRDQTATLLVRPRGWHLDEAHVLVDGRPLSASLFDFGLYFFHNAAELTSRGSGPYFYLPKLESHLEARLWNQVFTEAQRYCGIPLGSIRATVLIETLPAAFEMDEILYELRHHSAGLNCGRWDYIFSFIKVFSTRPDFLTPNREQIGMTQTCMDSYVRLLIQTCHRRGAHAMGGMAAQIPIRGDEDANDAAMAKVRGDKEREARAGHDGTWVAHPALVPIAREAFAAVTSADHQIEKRPRKDVSVTEEELVALPTGTLTMEGVVGNVEVALHYIEPWLRGVGCVPYKNLMEDAATAEIARTQVWQWMRHGAVTEDGTRVDEPLVRSILDTAVANALTALGPARASSSQFTVASRMLWRLLCAPELPDFLTTGAYTVVAHRQSRL